MSWYDNCFVVVIVCVGCVAVAERQPDKLGIGTKNAAEVIQEIETHTAEIHKMIDPSGHYTTRQCALMSSKWQSVLMLIKQIQDPELVPRKLIFKLMQVNLVMLRIAQPEVILLYGSAAVIRAFVHFGKTYRESKHQIDGTIKAKHEFEDGLEKKIEQMEAIKNDPEKKDVVSTLYSRMFNEVFTFSDVDNLSPSIATRILDLDDELYLAQPPILNTKTLMLRNNPDIGKDVGQILSRLHHDKRHAKAANYVNKYVD